MMMFRNYDKQVIKGIAIGIGVSAIGFYAYKKNEDSVNKFLKNHGINVEQKSGKDFYTMSLEELMEAKETIEDIIAEKDLNGVTIESASEEIPF